MNENYTDNNSKEAADQNVRGQAGEPTPNRTDARSTEFWDNRDSFWNSTNTASGSTPQGSSWWDNIGAPQGTTPDPFWQADSAQGSGGDFWNRPQGGYANSGQGNYTQTAYRQAAPQGNYGGAFQSYPGGPMQMPAGSMQTPPGAQPPVYAWESSRPSTGKLATASLVLGIIGFFTGFIFIGLVLDVIAIILGIVSLTSGKPKKGMAAAGILLSVLSILLTMLIYYLIGRSVTNPQVPIEPYEPTVQEAAVSAQLMPNIKVHDYDTGNGVVLVYENGNSGAVDYTINVTYYDDKGKILYVSQDYLMGCAGNSRAAMQVSPPYDDNYSAVSYARYEVTTLAEDSYSSYYSYYGDQFEITTMSSSDGDIYASVTNPTGLTFDCVELACIFYKNGEPVGLSQDYLWDFEVQDTVEFYAPYDANYRTVDYDDFEIIINSTCKYD